MPWIWEVVGGKDKGGIVVRKEKGLDSEKCPHRLSYGARVQQEEIVGERMCYLMVSGAGPRRGWVSIKLSNKDLLVRQARESGIAAPATFRDGEVPDHKSGDSAKTSAAAMTDAKARAQVAARVVASAKSKAEIAKADATKAAERMSPPKAPREVVSSVAKIAAASKAPVRKEPEKVVPPSGDVFAPVFYLADRFADPFYRVHQEDDEERMHAEFVAKWVVVKDSRPTAALLSLDTHGVMLAPHRTRLSTADFYDNPTRVWEVYYDEMRTLVQKATGASRVLIFAHHVRNQKLSHCRRGVQGYVGYAHNDYTPESGPQRLCDMATSAADADCKDGASAVSRSVEKRVRELAGPPVSQDELDDLLHRRRYIIVHVWRNIDNAPICADPLTVCDGRSLAGDDFVPFGLVYRDSVGQTYGVRHTDNHKWLFFSGMRKDEVMIFKGYDSKEDRGVRWTAHTAFADPRTPSDAPQRQSVEVRCVAIFDEGYEERTGFLAGTLFPELPRPPPPAEGGKLSLSFSSSKLLLSYRWQDL
mmetsp:Transcript_144376/g.254545  ORF Transcript_144376/g.254545 Transcript_144376/m.254545 type:complete len:531 (+) Transcript_144376:117-1709(+)